MKTTNQTRKQKQNKTQITESSLQLSNHVMIFQDTTNIFWEMFKTNTKTTHKALESREGKHSQQPSLP